MRKSLLLVVIVILSSFQVRLSAQDSLKARIDSLVEKYLPAGSEAGISVYDLKQQKSLYTYRDDKLCRPASTMKLLTAITALSQPDALRPFSTEVWYKGIISADTLKGDLYVVGGFDPEFGDEGMNALVDQVNAYPFTVIDGKVYGDISMKDSLYWGNGWAWDDTPASFQPYMSPLMYNKGKVSVKAVAITQGDTARVTCEPLSSYYTVVNETKSKTSSAGNFKVSRNWLENGNQITVRGNVTGTRVGEVNIYPSQDFFMHTFVERLNEKGIEVSNHYDYAELSPDSLSMRIAVWKCSVQDVINEIMKESDNLNAEALLHKMAFQSTGKKRVSAEDGIELIKQLIDKIGHSSKDYKLADGSGLSNYNYVTPALLVDLLKFAFSDTGIFQHLYKALPVSGTDGTLQYRMGKGSKAFRKVHAKTGSFTGICTLAGYLKASNGNDIAFAIMNQNVMTLAKARELQNKICELLCE